MELDFYSGFEYMDSVSVGKVLWNDIIQIKILNETTSDEVIIPEGFDGEGEKIERISLNEIRKDIIIGFSRLLSKYAKLDRDKENILAISKISEIITFLNNDKVTHLKLDI